MPKQCARLCILKIEFAEEKGYSIHFTHKEQIQKLAEYPMILSQNA